jgi:hypothetical protein
MLFLVILILFPILLFIAALFSTIASIMRVLVEPFDNCYDSFYRRIVKPAFKEKKRRARCIMIMISISFIPVWLLMFGMALAVASVMATLYTVLLVIPGMTFYTYLFIRTCYWWSPFSKRVNG